MKALRAKSETACFMHYKQRGVTVDYLYKIQMWPTMLLFSFSAAANNNILLRDPALNYYPGCVAFTTTQCGKTDYFRSSSDFTDILHPICCTTASLQIYPSPSTYGDSTLQKNPDVLCSFPPYDGALAPPTGWGEY